MGFGISNLESFQFGIWDFGFGIYFNLEFGISDLEFVSLKDLKIAGKYAKTLVNETKPDWQNLVQFNTKTVNYFVTGKRLNISIFS